jgi:hypothetical protein
MLLADMQLGCAADVCQLPGGVPPALALLRQRMSVLGGQLLRVDSMRNARCSASLRRSLLGS